MIDTPSSAAKGAADSSDNEAENRPHQRTSRRCFMDFSVSARDGEARRGEL